jgi:hypothetical protein
MHYILTSTSITPTYVSALTSHPQQHKQQQHKILFYFMLMYEVFKIELMDVKHM